MEHFKTWKSLVNIIEIIVTFMGNRPSPETVSNLVECAFHLFQHRQRKNEHCTKGRYRNMDSPRPPLVFNRKKNVVLKPGRRRVSESRTADGLNSAASLSTAATARDYWQGMCGLIFALPTLAERKCTVRMTVAVKCWVTINNKGQVFTGWNWK